MLNYLTFIRLVFSKLFIYYGQINLVIDCVADKIDNYI
jgi:hypothetical protein